MAATTVPALRDSDCACEPSMAAVLLRTCLSGSAPDIFLPRSEHMQPSSRGSVGWDLFLREFCLFISRTMKGEVVVVVEIDRAGFYFVDDRG